MSIELAFSSTHCTSLSIVPCGPTLTLPRVAGEGKCSVEHTIGRTASKTVARMIEGARDLASRYA